VARRQPSTIATRTPCAGSRHRAQNPMIGLLKTGKYDD
jgi:hypothetical protein